MQKKNNTKPTVGISLSAIDPFKKSNLVLPIEASVRNKDYILWGEDNKYPDYLLDLFQSVATLQSVIVGTADYICGDSISLNAAQQVNSKGDTIADLVRKIAIDKLIFGGYAIQVIRNRVGEVSELYYIDFSKLRSNEDNTIFTYSDNWTAWSVKTIQYPRFNYTDKNPSSIYYSKGSLTRSVYPTPIYSAAIIPCEVEKSINQFHLNEINNNFLTSAIINFNNGKPNDVQKEEIERLVNEKFSGKDNAGRILISYNDSADNATTIERLSEDGYDERYSSLAERSRAQIFTAFRANPRLCGLDTDSTGFSTTEYNDAFALYNRTVVKPLQKDIINSFNKIYNTDNAITIVPFTLNTD